MYVVTHFEFCAERPDNDLQIPKRMSDFQQLTGTLMYLKI